MILGIKATHDGGFVLLKSNRLLLSVEMEKVNNNERHARPSRMDDIERLIVSYGFNPHDVEEIVFDGWWPDREGWLEHPTPTTKESATAPYVEEHPELLMLPQHVGEILFDMRMVPTIAYPHSVGHVFGAYCTSPFASHTARVLVWDGGMPATIYNVSPKDATRLGVVLPITGNLYPVFCSLLEPYRELWESTVVDAINRGLPMGDKSWQRYSLGVPGKAMAYAGLGRVNPDVVQVLRNNRDLALTENEPVGDEVPDYLHGEVVWVKQIEHDLRALRTSVDDPSLMASFTAWMYEELELGLRPYADDMPLIFTGGCALNIKWNSKLRSSGMFSDVWVPPFPNDAGGALGVACAEMVMGEGYSALSWSVYAGPSLPPPPSRWFGWACLGPTSPTALGKHLSEHNDPVVVLYGGAELGPRALGHRSILAPATSPTMKRRLNDIKGREDYRPVAPICLEEWAPEMFFPGTPDRYMLFDHQVNPEWMGRIPAVVHSDGTARLQTVQRADLGGDSFIREVLESYCKETGIPMLCNTSANLNGCGFFPNAESAMTWGKCKYVWADGIFYERTT